jgi:DNA polymerase-3 subunit alpha
MEKYLKNTYGVIAYQEQLILIPRLVANFNRKESNTLRKAFGKRQKNIIAEMKTKFIEGGMKNGHDKKALEYVWEDMERKGIYAFNKAHGVCYTWIGYQMAYLKTHFPKEFNQVITDYASENKH